MLTVSTTDYLWYVDQALDAMTALASDLGNGLVNRAPDLTGANSPFAIVTHCLGVMAFWGGEIVAGHDVDRDRDAELRATGTVEELADAVRQARAQFEADLAELVPTDPPRRPPSAEDAALPVGRTQGGVLLHVLEELLQHLGQLELTRDVLRATGMTV